MHRPFSISQRAMFEQSKVSESVDSSPSQRRNHGVNSYIRIIYTRTNKSSSIAHIFPVMANPSVLSVGQLFNKGYTLTFRIDSVATHNSRETQILKGARDLDTLLWRINLCKEHQQDPQ
jgi:hypothetical protein